MQRVTWIVAITAAFALSACSKGGEEKKAPAKTEKAAKKAEAPKPASKPAEAKPAEPAAGGDVSEAAMAEAKTVFTTRCATCHGAGGEGDGPASAALNPKPRTLTSHEWQDSVTDEHIAKVIVKGGESVGLSPMMAANPDLDSKPEVVKGLVKLVRGLKK